jgi:hypothetical protein
MPLSTTPYGYRTSNDPLRPTIPLVCKKNSSSSSSSRPPWISATLIYAILQKKNPKGKPFYPHLHVPTKENVLNRNKFFREVKVKLRLPWEKQLG